MELDLQTRINLLSSGYDGVAPEPLTPTQALSLLPSISDGKSANYHGPLRGAVLWQGTTRLHINQYIDNKHISLTSYDYPNFLLRGSQIPTSDNLLIVDILSDGRKKCEESSIGTIIYAIPFHSTASFTNKVTDEDDFVEATFTIEDAVKTEIKLTDRKHISGHKLYHLPPVGIVERGIKILGLLADEMKQEFRQVEVSEHDNIAKLKLNKFTITAYVPGDGYTCYRVIFYNSDINDDGLKQLADSYRIFIQPDDSSKGPAGNCYVAIFGTQNVTRIPEFVKELGI